MSSISWSPVSLRRAGLIGLLPLSLFHSDPAAAEPRILLTTADASTPCAAVTTCGALSPAQPDTGLFVLRIVLNDVQGVTSASFGLWLPEGCTVEDVQFCDSFGFVDDLRPSREVLVALGFVGAVPTSTLPLVALLMHATAPGVITIEPRSDVLWVRVTMDGVPHEIPEERRGRLVIGDGAGALPCVDVVPTVATTWSLLKALHVR